MTTTVNPAVRKKEILFTARVMVFGILSALLVLGVFQYRAKSAANKTANDWRTELEKAAEGNDRLLESGLQDLVRGNPVVTKLNLEAAQKPDEMEFVNSLKMYVWSGPFSKYTVSVYLLLGEDPEVEAVHGPQEPQAADEPGSDAPLEDAEGAEAAPAEGDAPADAAPLEGAVE